jgi:Sel1 repeat
VYGFDFCDPLPGYNSGGWAIRTAVRGSKRPIHGENCKASVPCGGPPGPCLGLVPGGVQAPAALRERASKGSPEAQTALGKMHRDGLGVHRDLGEAVRWFRQAAIQGYAEAENSLGFLYDYRGGLPIDHQEAARWYRKAADLGLASAQYELGVAYSSGLGVSQDLAAAHEWMDLAVFRARGPVRERYSAARDALPAQMTTAQLTEGQRRAPNGRPSGRTEGAQS